MSEFLRRFSSREISELIAFSIVRDEEDSEAKGKTPSREQTPEEVLHAIDSL